MRKPVSITQDILDRFAINAEDPNQPPGPRSWARLQWPEVYGNDHPIEIEVGFGKGLFLTNSGTLNPSVNYLGLEYERKFVYLTAKKLARLQLENVRVACTDAKVFFRDRVPEASVQAVHVYFPDPWWKNTHRKRQLLIPEFVGLIHQILIPGGRLHYVTDVEENYQRSLGIIAKCVGLKSLPPPEEGQPSHDMDYLTNFERKYRKEGRAIFRALFEKHSG